ncbi:hypothetical protein ZIOFF_022823 [Zingiber officinale]|uniref:UBP-type domain-containing protein n=1 Tax=Zingiber officinale TaxID=94328 RepID=A0A8J5HA80_ZINOF|nr:hypothetical protein ZIOFF_022823 [Zingiber officinale]
MVAEHSSSTGTLKVDEEEFFGVESRWVEAGTTCDHLPLLCYDLSQIPLPIPPALANHQTTVPCIWRSRRIKLTGCVKGNFRCHQPVENWLCLSCKDVFCSRFINKHMVNHHQETGHCLALSFSDLSVWCFNCNAYLDVQMIRQLRPIYEVRHLLKFDE